MPVLVFQFAVLSLYLVIFYTYVDCRTELMQLLCHVSCVLMLTVKQNGDLVMSELSGQMEDAAAATTKAYANLRHLRHMEKSDASNNSSNAITSDEAITEKVKEKEWKLPAELLIMQPIFRFLQLLCENHNSELQVCWRITIVSFTILILAVVVVKYKNNHNYRNINSSSSSSSICSNSNKKITRR